MSEELKQKFNLQPYDEDCIDVVERITDIRTAPRTVDWIRRNFLDFIKENIQPNDLKKAVDIGCGNGRFFSTIAGLGFSQVWGIDPAETLNPKYKESFAVFFKSTLAELFIGFANRDEKPFGCAFLIGSFNILRRTYGVPKIMEMLSGLTDQAFFMIDASDLELYESGVIESGYANYEILENKSNSTVMIHQVLQ